MVFAVLIFLFKVKFDFNIPTDFFTLSLVFPNWILHCFCFTGVHLQPENICQFPTCVALHPRCILHDGTRWHCRCDYNYRFDSCRHICLHLSVCSDRMGNSFGEVLFCGFLFFYFFIFYFLFKSFLSAADRMGTVSCFLFGYFISSDATFFV